MIKNSKNVFLTLILSVALSLFSAFAFAEGGLPDVERVCAKLKEATAAVAAGQSSAEVATLAKEAKSLTKEIIVSDQVTMAKEVAIRSIKAAVSALKKDDMAGADVALKKALADFEAIKKQL